MCGIGSEYCWGWLILIGPWISGDRKGEYVHHDGLYTASVFLKIQDTARKKALPNKAVLLSFSFFVWCHRILFNNYVFLIFDCVFMETPCSKVNGWLPLYSKYQLRRGYPVLTITVTVSRMCFVFNVLTGAEWHVNTNGRRNMNYELCMWLRVVKWMQSS